MSTKSNGSVATLGRKEAAGRQREAEQKKRAEELKKLERILGVTRDQIRAGGAMWHIDGVDITIITPQIDGSKDCPRACLILMRGDQIAYCDFWCTGTPDMPRKFQDCHNGEYRTYDPDRAHWHPAYQKLQYLRTL